MALDGFYKLPVARAHLSSTATDVLDVLSLLTATNYTKIKYIILTGHPPQ